MNGAAFEAALDKFEVVRQRDYQGGLCRKWTAEEARAHRERTAAAAKALEQEQVKRDAARRQRGQAALGASGFLDALRRELEAAGYQNVEEVLQELHKTLEEKLYSGNLETLESILRG